MHPVIVLLISHTTQNIVEIKYMKMNFHTVVQHSCFCSCFYIPFPLIFFHFIAQFWVDMNKWSTATLTQNVGFCSRTHVIHLHSSQTLVASFYSNKLAKTIVYWVFHSLKFLYDSAFLFRLYVFFFAFKFIWSFSLFSLILFLRGPFLLFLSWKSWVSSNGSVHSF